MEIKYDTKIEGQVDLKDYVLETEFNEGLALVSNKENCAKYFYIIKRNGEIIKGIGCGDTATKFNDGVSVVAGNNIYSLVYPNGECKFLGSYCEYVGKFSDGLAPFMAEIDDGYDGYRWGFIDKNGKEKVKAKYHDAKPFCNGFARVQIGDNWGYINNKGEEVIPCQYKNASNFGDGVAAVEKEGSGVTEFIDEKGKVIGTLPERYTVVGGATFSDGLIEVLLKSKYMEFKIGFANKNGQVVIEPSFTFTQKFSEGRCLVGKMDGSNNKCGYINKKGDFVIKTNFLVGSCFEDGYAFGYDCNDSNKTYIIDTKGNIIKELPKKSTLYMKDKVLVYGNAIVPFENILDLKLKYTVSLKINDGNEQEYEFDTQNELDKFRLLLEKNVKEFETEKEEIRKKYEDELECKINETSKIINKEYKNIKNK